MAKLPFGLSYIALDPIMSRSLTKKKPFLSVVGRSPFNDSANWLRPEFQNPYGTATAVQAEMTLVREDTPLPEKAPSPKDHTAQLQADRSALSAFKNPTPAGDVAKYFLKARPAKVSALLEDLVKLGLARKEGERYIA